MNTTISSFAVVSLFIMSFAVAGSDTNRDDIAARLKPEGQVNIAGAVAAISKVSRSGADIYQTSCAMCHTSGALSAPKSGDAEENIAPIDEVANIIIITSGILGI